MVETKKEGFRGKDNSTVTKGVDDYSGSLVLDIPGYSIGSLGYSIKYSSELDYSGALFTMPEFNNQVTPTDLAAGWNKSWVFVENYDELAGQVIMGIGLTVAAATVLIGTAGAISIVGGAVVITDIVAFAGALASVLTGPALPFIIIGVVIALVGAAIWGVNELIDWETFTTNSPVPPRMSTSLSTRAPIMYWFARGAELDLPYVRSTKLWNTHDNKENKSDNAFSFKSPSGTIYSLASYIFEAFEDDIPDWLEYRKNPPGKWRINKEPRDESSKFISIEFYQENIELNLEIKRTDVTLSKRYFEVKNATLETAKATYTFMESVGALSEVAYKDSDTIINYLWTFTPQTFNETEFNVGALQMISLFKGEDHLKSIKFFPYSRNDISYLVTVLSEDPVYSSISENDQFLYKYTMDGKYPVAPLKKIETLTNSFGSQQLGDMNSDDISANESNYFDTLDHRTIEYNFHHGTKLQESYDDPENFLIEDSYILENELINGPSSESEEHFIEIKDAENHSTVYKFGSIAFFGMPVFRTQGDEFWYEPIRKPAVIEIQKRDNASTFHSTTLDDVYESTIFDYEYNLDESQLSEYYYDSTNQISHVGFGPYDDYNSTAREFSTSTETFYMKDARRKSTTKTIYYYSEDTNDSSYVVSNNKRFFSKNYTEFDFKEAVYTSETQEDNQIRGAGLQEFYISYDGSETWDLLAKREISSWSEISEDSEISDKSHFLPETIKSYKRDLTDPLFTKTMTYDDRGRVIKETLRYEDPSFSEDPRFYEKSEVTCVGDSSGSLAGKYWTLSFSDGSDYAIWYCVSGSGSGPTGAGTNYQINISTNDTAEQIAVATKTVFDTSFSDEISVSRDGSTLTITELVLGSSDGAVDVDTGFTIQTINGGMDDDPDNVLSFTKETYIQYIDGSCVSGMFDDNPYNEANLAISEKRPKSNIVSGVKEKISNSGDYKKSFKLFLDPDVPDDAADVKLLNYKSTIVEKSSLSSEERFSDYNHYDWAPLTYRDYGYGQAFELDSSDLESNEREITIRNWFDDSGNLIQAQTPNGSFVEYEYFPDGVNKGLVRIEKRKISDNINGDDQYFINETIDYNLMGNPLESSVYMAKLEEGELRKFRGIYNSETKGWQYPEIVTRNEYDDQGRQTKTFINDIQLSENTYDDTNKVKTSTTRAGNRTKTYFDDFYRAFKTEKFRPESQNIEDNAFSSDDLNFIRLSYSEVTEYDRFYKDKPLKTETYLDDAGTNKIITTIEIDNRGRQVAKWHKNTLYTSQDSDVTKGKKISETIYKDDIDEIWSKAYRNDNEEWNLSRIKKDLIERKREIFSYKNVYTDDANEPDAPEVQYLNLNNATTTILDSEDHMTTTINKYDLMGNAVEVEHPSGDKYFSVYSSKGKIEKTMMLPQGGSEPDDIKITSIANYDLQNNILASQNRGGVKVHFYYNENNQIAKQYSESIPSVSVYTKHSHLGPVELTKYEDEELLIKTEREYNSFGEITLTKQTIDGMSRTILNTFSSGGQAVSSTVTGLSGWEKSLTIEHIYYKNASSDNTDHASSSAVFEGLNPDVLNDTPLLVTRNEYNGEISLTYKNGKVSKVEKRSSDGFMRPTKIEHDYDGGSGENVVEEYSSRDWRGNIQQIDSDMFTYDGIGRIKTAEGFTYTYDDESDPNGINNIKKIEKDTNNYKEFEYNDSDAMRMTRFREVVSGQDIIDWSYSYDKRGNVVEISDRFNRLKWDEENRLREIEYYPDEFNRIGKDKYWYGAGGLRYKKEEHIGLTTNTEKTYYMYNGNDIILEEIFIGDKPVKAKYNTSNSVQYQANFEEGE